MRKQRNDRGASAVEFALVLPILMLLICGIVDFGRAFNARITLTNAAREAVRVWALGGSYDATRAAAIATAAPAEAPPTKLTNVTITNLTNTSPPCPFGQTTTVTVRGDFSYVFPLIGNLGSPGSTISVSGVMRCEG